MNVKTKIKKEIGVSHKRNPRTRRRFPPGRRADEERRFYTGGLGWAGAAHVINEVIKSVGGEGAKNLGWIGLQDEEG